ncbi:MAG: recombinase family protein, partial [Chloroflexi bacterium]
MIACALYTRVSSRGQLDGDYNSLETQRERLEAYCKSQGWDVYRVYEDGGYSAETLNRPALKDMLRDIASGKVQRVIAYKIDRLTRSVKDFHALMEIFEKSNVCFVSVTQSIDTSTPTGRLMRNILLDFAQFEREMTADRTRDKLHQRAQKGMWNGGTAPYGYGKKDKKLVVNPEEAKVVRFMFQQFADDPNLARMRAELHRRGWLTRAGGKWGKAVLHHILRNPVYCGETRFLEHTYKGEHESIVDETLFKRVQTAPPNRTHERTRIQRTFLLKGLAKCGDCGSFLTPHYTQKRRKD